MTHLISPELRSTSVARRALRPHFALSALWRPGRSCSAAQVGESRAVVGGAMRVVPLTLLILALPVRALEFERMVTLHYGPDSLQEGDLYLPIDDGTRRRAAVVLIHGGGWGEGTKTGARIPQACELLASNGFVAYTINYTLGAKAWGAVPDAFTAVRFLRARADEYRIDRNAIGAAGWSAGGWSACYLGWTLPGDTAHVHNYRDSANKWVDSVFAFEPQGCLYPEYPSQVSALFLSSGLWFGNVRTEVWNFRPGRAPNPPEKLPPVFIIGGDVTKFGEFRSVYDSLGGGEIKTNFIPQMKHAPSLVDSEGGVSWDLNADFVAWFTKHLPVGTVRTAPLSVSRMPTPVPSIRRVVVLTRDGSGTARPVVIMQSTGMVDLVGRR